MKLHDLVETYDPSEDAHEDHRNEMRGVFDREYQSVFGALEDDLDDLGGEPSHTMIKVMHIADPHRFGGKATPSTDDMEDYYVHDEEAENFAHLVKAGKAEQAAKMITTFEDWMDSPEADEAAADHYSDKEWHEQPYKARGLRKSDFE